MKIEPITGKFGLALSAEYQARQIAGKISLFRTIIVIQFGK